MKLRLFKKIKAYRKWLKDNPEFEHKFPEVKNLDSCYVEVNGAQDSTCMATSWPNGEGYDFSWYNKKENNKSISLHDADIEGMLECLISLKHFEIE